MRKAPPSRFIAATLLCLGPLLLWSLHFGAVYMIDHFACAADAASAGSLVTSGILAATVVILLLLAVWVWQARRILSAFDLPDDLTGFLRTTATWLSAAAALAVTWAGTAAFVLPACDSLR